MLQGINFINILLSRYDRGFCRHGPHCRHRHVRRVLCINYLSGFCPEGPNCKYMHPRFELPAPPEQTKDAKRLPVCHYCSEVGHKASTCHKIPPEVRFLLSAKYNVAISAILVISYFSNKNLGKNIPCGIFFVLWKTLPESEHCLP